MNKEVKIISVSENLCTERTDVISERNQKNIQNKYYSPKKIRTNSKKDCYHGNRFEAI